MVTDEKRRRVVHTLRQLDHIVDDEDCDRTIAHEASVLNMIRDATSGIDGSIFRRLADLIDRHGNPTCRNLSNDCRSFHCSRCGYKASAHGGPGCGPEDPTYCPECRAEVVDGD